MPETADIIPRKGEDALSWLKRPPPHRKHPSFRGRGTAYDLGTLLTWGGENLAYAWIPSLPRSFIYLDSASLAHHLWITIVRTAAILEP